MRLEKCTGEGYGARRQLVARAQTRRTPCFVRALGRSSPLPASAMKDRVAIGTHRGFPVFAIRLIRVVPLVVEDAIAISRHSPGWGRVCWRQRGSGHSISRLVKVLATAAAQSCGIHCIASVDSLQAGYENLPRENRNYKSRGKPTPSRVQSLGGAPAEAGAPCRSNSP